MKGSLFIRDDTIPEMWIDGICNILFHGNRVKTQYDIEGDVYSWDVFGVIELTNPFKKEKGRTYRNPFRTVRGNPIYSHILDTYCVASIASGDYLDEMMGSKDHLIHDSDVSFPYTYHDRIFRYKAKDPGSVPIDQMRLIEKKISDVPYTRRAQAVTWRPYEDPMNDDPPCLRAIWFREVNGKLNMHTHWRSRDYWGAWAANVNGMFLWWKNLCDKCNMKPGIYRDVSDSLHIYGRIKKLRELARVVETAKKREGIWEEFNKKEEWIEFITILED